MSIKVSREYSEKARRLCAAVGALSSDANVERLAYALAEAKAEAWDECAKERNQEEDADIDEAAVVLEKALEEATKATRRTRKMLANPHEYIRFNVVGQVKTMGEAKAAESAEKASA